MNISWPTRILCLLALFLGAVPLASARSTYKPVPAAPIPPLLMQAKTIFISNAGEEDHMDWVVGGNNSPKMKTFTYYSGGQARLYNQFYAAMQAWGRYKIVSSPEQADLIFQIGYLHLIILDAKMKVTLWSLSDVANPAVLLRNRNRNFDLALSNLVDHVEQIFSLPAGGSSSTSSKIQTWQSIPAAPIPPLLTQAKTIFIADAGDDDPTDRITPLGNPAVKNFAFYSGSQARIYNQFYAAMQAWGKYKIAASPKQADLTFQIGDISAGTKLVGIGTTMLLMIRDTKTQTILWSMCETVAPAITLQNRKMNFNMGLSHLVDDVKQLLSSSSPSSSSKFKTSN